MEGLAFLMPLMTPCFQKCSAWLKHTLWFSVPMKDAKGIFINTCSRFHVIRNRTEKDLKLDCNQYAQHAERIE